MEFEAEEELEFGKLSLESRQNQPCDRALESA
jgi:hypothetical protein